MQNGMVENGSACHGKPFAEAKEEMTGGELGISLRYGRTG